MDHTVGKQNGWRERLVPVHNENTGGGTGLCLDIHDLAVSKLIAGREKDIDFLTGLLRHCLVRLPILRDRLTPKSWPICVAKRRRRSMFSKSSSKTKGLRRMTKISPTRAAGAALSGP